MKFETKLSAAVVAATAMLASALAAAPARADDGPAGVQASPASGAVPVGVWRNPKNNVHLDIRPCGDKVCGVVIWASAHAQEDALRGSGKPLIGQQLLRDFTWDRRGYWRGKVFVPDLNNSFSGTAEAVGANTLKAKGCLLGRLICKSQNWVRVQ